MERAFYLVCFPQTARDGEQPHDDHNEWWIAWRHSLSHVIILAVINPPLFASHSKLSIRMWLLDSPVLGQRRREGTESPFIILWIVWTGRNCSLVLPPLALLPYWALTVELSHFVHSFFYRDICTTLWSKHTTPMFPLVYFHFPSESRKLWLLKTLRNSCARPPTWTGPIITQLFSR